ncbi:MAG: hypothetical protein Fur0016_31100 [Anaerolineales bacterium]
MKINRFFAMAAIALLVVGAMSAISLKAYAQGNHNGTAVVSAQADACAQDQADGTEVASAPDTDNVDLQCGDQNGADGQEIQGVEAPEGQEAQGAAESTTVESAADTDNVQEEVGDQNAPDTGVEAPEVEAPAPTAVP